MALVIDDAEAFSATNASANTIVPSNTTAGFSAALSPPQPETARAQIPTTRILMCFVMTIPSNSEGPRLDPATRWRSLPEPKVLPATPPIHSCRWPSEAEPKRSGRHGSNAVQALGGRRQRVGFARRPIDGVQFRPTRPVVHDDGTLAEIARTDWPEIDQPIVHVHVTTTEPGRIRGWGLHQHSTDRLFVVRGLVSIVVFDGRRLSPTYGQVNEFKVSERNPGLLVIPPDLYHGWKVIGTEEAFIINMPTAPTATTSPTHSTCHTRARMRLLSSRGDGDANVLRRRCHLRSRPTRSKSTLESVARQTVDNIEVLVVSDGPAAPGLAATSHVSEDGFSLVECADRCGSQWAPNNYGWLVATGRFIAYLGHDDIWLPGHLAALHDAFEAHPRADFAASGCIHFGPPGSGDGYSWVTGCSTRDDRVDGAFPLLRAIVGRSST